MKIGSLAQPALSESQRHALISLLGDDDPAIYHQIRGRLLSYGEHVHEWLRPYTLSNDPVIRRRSQEIVRFLSRQEIDNEFLSFCLRQGEELNLEEGVWLLARTRYPDINIHAYQALLDAYAGDLQERLFKPGMSGREVLQTIQRYLYDEVGFRGNEENYYEADNSYLNRVLDRKTGNPISLCSVYLALARRLHLPIAGIGLPGHFLCRYQTPTEEIYVDAFNRGKLLTKADCVKYLVENDQGFQERYLTPVSPRRILLRICANLHQVAVQLEHSEETSRFQRYIVALAR